MNIFFFLMVFAPLFGSTGSGGSQLVDSLTSCFSAQDLGQRSEAEQQLRRDLKRPDLRFKVLSGYSNNEISSTNPERFQVGANLRWEDMTDQQARRPLMDSTSESVKEESKLILENYWRLKLQDFYFWKWGHSSLENAQSFLIYSQNKLAAADDSLDAIATSKVFSDLIELNRLASEFTSKMEALEKEFHGCQGLKNWKEEFDFNQQEIENASQKTSQRILYQNNFCTAQKKIKSINLARESGLWGLALNTSLTRNRQLAGGSNQFNDFRFGLELIIPLTGAKSEEVKVDRCDYDAKLLLSEDQAERAIAKNLYPVLNSFLKQHLQMKKKLKKLDFKSQGTKTEEIVQLGLNYFKLHNSLAIGEAKMSATILPSQIVEHEF